MQALASSLRVGFAMSGKEALVELFRPREAHTSTHNFQQCFTAHAEDSAEHYTYTLQ